MNASGIWYDRATPLGRYLLKVLSYVGTPYLWGAKGMRYYTGLLTPAFALDCSGGVTVAAQAAGGPDLRDTHKAHRLADESEPVEVPEPGDLAFYGLGKVVHVMTVLSRLPSGEVFVVGPSGGDSSTTTLEMARQQCASSKVYPTHLYRADFLRFGKGLFR